MNGKITKQIFDLPIANNSMIRWVFMDLLLLCDNAGRVDMTHEAIARTTKAPIETVRQAVKELEGSILIRMDKHRDWGWIISDHQSYFNQSRKEYMRAYMAQYRKKRSEVAT